MSLEWAASQTFRTEGQQSRSDDSSNVPPGRINRASPSASSNSIKGCGKIQMCPNVIDFRRGNQYPDLVLLGACPGQKEWNAQPRRPFAGRSGANLHILLRYLGNMPEKHLLGLNNDDFSSICIDDYTLMNSHPEPKWRSKDGRSTPWLREVDDPENIQRLITQLKEVEARVVVGLGRPLHVNDMRRLSRNSGPMRAIRKLSPQLPGIFFFVTGHPSPRAINRYGNGNARDWFVGGFCRFPP